MDENNEKSLVAPVQLQENSKKEQINTQNPVITSEDIRKATMILKEYKEGKRTLENKIVENEKWWKSRHWENFRSGEEQDIEPVSGWLFNSIANKHADASDNYPEPNILPREQDDESVAKKLSSIVPVVLEQNEYEQTYSDTWWYKLKNGTGVKGVFWNTGKMNGLGDIDICKIELLNLYWKPGITDIQQSPNVFHVALVDTEELKKSYPGIDITSGDEIDITKYQMDDDVKTDGLSLVVDWYYKKVVDGAVQLHFVKYANDKVLYASENESEYNTIGYYEHGKYPFVFDTLFPEEGTPVGFGYVDIMKNCQMYIDRLDKATLENALALASPRWFANEGAGINEEEFFDMTKKIVHVKGTISQDTIYQMPVQSMPGIYLNLLQNKVDELKETSGNRDFSQGATSSGVTAASAIAALQEAGSKMSRDMLKASYRAFAQECYLVIELIRQFYDEPRCFRITGERGENQFEYIDNGELKPQGQEKEFGVDIGERLPVFDIKVYPSKRSSFSRITQNELGLQFYNAGFFEPARADQALACLSMMDFEQKDTVMDKIKNNQTMAQQIAMLNQQVQILAQKVDQQNGTNLAQGAAMQAAGQQETGATGKAEMPADQHEFSQSSGSQLVDNVKANAASQARP